MLMQMGKAAAGPYSFSMVVTNKFVTTFLIEGVILITNRADAIRPYTDSSLRKAKVIPSPDKCTSIIRLHYSHESQNKAIRKISPVCSAVC